MNADRLEKNGKSLQQENIRILHTNLEHIRRFIDPDELNPELVGFLDFQQTKKQILGFPTNQYGSWIVGFSRKTNTEISNLDCWISSKNQLFLDSWIFN